MEGEEEEGEEIGRERVRGGREGRKRGEGIRREEGGEKGKGGIDSTEKYEHGEVSLNHKFLNC